MHGILDSGSTVFVLLWNGRRSTNSNRQSLNSEQG